MLVPKAVIAKAAEEMSKPESSASLELEKSLIEAAREALPGGEGFPISFLQRGFRLGYNRALRLHKALSIPKDQHY